MPKPKKHTEVIKEKYGDEQKKDLMPEQPNLFGDQDFVFNAIQEEISGIHSDIERAIDYIDKKRDALADLRRRKNQLDNAALIIRKSKHLLKKKEKNPAFQPKKEEEEQPF